MPRSKNHPRKPNRPQPRPPSRRRPAPSRGRTAVFQGILALTPVLFFVLLEAGLRLGGYGVKTDLVLEVKEKGIHTYVLNPDVGRRYFSPQMRPIQPVPGFRTFAVSKPPGALRVFALGGSSTAGFPFHVNGSFPGFLEDELRAAYPDRTIEVVNCAMTAINSFTVLDFVRQLVHYDPDLFNVYMGHNEFYGALGAGSASRAAGSRAMTLLQMRLAKLRTYQLLSDALFRFRNLFSRGTTRSGRTLMATMVREKRIRLEDPLHKKAERMFRENLNAILDVAAKHQVPVILSTLTSNLRDLPPFDSAHRDGLPKAESDRIDETLPRAVGGSGTLGDLRAAVAEDTTYAAARFALARALDRTGLYDEARREYVGARDHDVVHFRACSVFNAIVRDAAAARHVPLVDMEEVFEERSPQRIPGQNLFLEHLHPNLYGAMVMADAFRAKMVEMNLLPTLPHESAWAASDPEASIERAAITPLDFELARERIKALTHQWPFERAYAELRFPYAAGSEEVRLVAERVLRKSLTLEKAHEALGRRYIQENEAEKALEEFRALAKIFPVTPVGPQTAAELLMHLGRPAEAVPYYRQALAVAPGNAEIEQRLETALAASAAAGASTSAPVGSAPAVGAAQGGR
jgi:tetratricopeptide (TPR) repeat protein